MPIFPFKNGEDCIVACHRIQNGRLFLHLVTVERGSGAAAIEVIRNPSVEEVAAPDRREFIHSQLFLLCCGNDLLWTTHNNALREGAINFLLNEMIDYYNEDPEPSIYLLEAILDDEKFEEILHSGIQEIDLDVGGFQQNLEYVVNGGRLPEAGAIAAMMSMFSENPSDEEREAASKVMGRLILKPGRQWNDVHVRELLGNAAERIIENDEEGFAIVTKSGLRITKDKLQISEQFEVEGNSRLIERNQVALRLEQAYERFLEIGILER
jgi:hypothetical protein